MIPKDEIFTKFKTYIDRETGQQKEVKAGWRNFNLGGKPVVLIKGKELSKQDAELVKKYGRADHIEKIEVKKSK